MLHEFLTANRDILIARCRQKVARRSAAPATEAELQHGIPLFLQQLVRTLELEQTSTPLDSRRISGPSEPGMTTVSSEIGTSAAKHGDELLRHGFTVDQVVHDYGDLCQAITELAVELAAPVTTDEFRTLNRCLDNAIADAVTEYGRQRDKLGSRKRAEALGEQLGSLAHELRNLLDTAMLAVAAIRTGDVGIGGATGAVLDRSLLGLRDVINRSLAEARLEAGMPARRERISVADFVAEVHVAALLEAKARGCALSVAPVDRDLAIDGDRQMLSSAVANLLQNAFKFSGRDAHVALRAYAAADRVLIEIEDECGGLPHGTAEQLFQPFAQRGADRSGLGLGLSIARRSVEANAGTVRVLDRPGAGCVFTIDLPRRAR